MKKLNHKAVLKAAESMDWQQVVLNGGPPCFHLEGGRFCGRAERWDGHLSRMEGSACHKFVSLKDLILSANEPAKGKG